MEIRPLASARMRYGAIDRLAIPSSEHWFDCNKTLAAGVTQVHPKFQL